MKKKIEILIILIVIFQILLMVNMSIAHSYILHQTLPLIENSKIVKDDEENKINDIINLGIN